MGTNLFKKFDEYGFCGISGKVISVNEETKTAVAKASVYDKAKKKSIDTEFAIDLSDVGGAYGIEPDMNITAIGQIQGQNENKQVKVNAKVADIGNCRVTYNGYGIVAGECYYQTKTDNKGQEFLDAKINVIDRDNEQKVSNHIRITGYKGDNTNVNRLTERLEKMAKDNKLEQKTHAEKIFEGYPCESAFAFKVSPDYEKPREFTPEGKDITYYTRTNFAMSPNAYNVGFFNMALIKEREEAVREYNESREETKTNEKENEENEFHGIAEDDNIPFDFEKMDYGE